MYSSSRPSCQTSYYWCPCKSTTTDLSCLFPFGTISSVTFPFYFLTFFSHNAILYFSLFILFSPRRHLVQHFPPPDTGFRKRPVVRDSLSTFVPFPPPNPLIIINIRTNIRTSPFLPQQSERYSGRFRLLKPRGKHFFYSENLQEEMVNNFQPIPLFVAQKV